jgi:2'-5' RNA ligase
MPRLFCALRIPAGLSLDLSQLCGGLSGAKWIDRENYHITLQFFGDVDRHHANDLAVALSGIRRHAFELEIDRLDAFGHSKPHTVYASIKANPTLNELQGEIVAIGRRLGLTQDKRKFAPHVTIARLRGTSPIEAAGYLALKGGFNSRPFPVNAFDLMSSKASIGGGPYITEQRYDLADYDETAWDLKSAAW